MPHVDGLHHVTALASDARANNAFYTGPLGLRRVKKTVNFDAPEVYHLYYGDRLGTPGGVMTYFPFPGAGPGRAGQGETHTTAFAIPAGAAAFWAARLGAEIGESAFGAPEVTLRGPDGERLALVEAPEDGRAGHATDDVPAERAILGFHSVALQVGEIGPMADLLGLMGYEEAARTGNVLRMARPGGIAGLVDLIETPDAPMAQQGAGSVHHIAFSVPDRAAQAEMSAALAEAGHRATPVIDRDYFYAIYFRSPAGILFEIATAEPGFDRDEAVETLGEALKLPEQHEHLRPRLERELAPL